MMLKKFILIIVINSLIFSPLVFAPKPVQAQLSKVIADELTNLGIFTGVTQGAASAADAQRAITVPVFDIVQYSQIRFVETAKATKESKSNILKALSKIGRAHV